MGERVGRVLRGCCEKHAWRVVVKRCCGVGVADNIIAVVVVLVTCLMWFNVKCSTYVLPKIQEQTYCTADASPTIPITPPVALTALTALAWRAPCPKTSAAVHSHVLGSHAAASALPHPHGNSANSQVLHTVH